MKKLFFLGLLSVFFIASFSTVALGEEVEIGIRVILASYEGTDIDARLEDIQKKLAKSVSKKLAFYNVERHCVHGDSSAMKKKYPLLIFTERNGLRICGTKASLALYPELQDELDKTETELKNLLTPES